MKYFTPRLKTIIFFLVIGAILAAIQIVPAGFTDPDGYYHVQIARIIASGQYLNSFPWLTATSWAHTFADQHFLYHVLLIPFISVNPIVGAQIFNVLAGLAFAVIFYLLLKRLNVLYPKFWTLLMIFGSSLFLMRLSLVKAIPVSLFLVFLFLYYFHKKNILASSLILFIFTWAYGGFIFMPVIICIYLFSHVLAKIMSIPDNLPADAGAHAGGGGVEWKLILTPILAIFAGILLHPHPGNLVYHLYTQIFQAGLNYQIPVGNEWQPFSFFDLVGGNGFIFPFFVVAAYLAVKKLKKGMEGKTTLFFLFLSLFFLVLALKSFRFVEYAVPFMSLLSAMVFTPYLEAIPWSFVKKRLAEDFLIYLPLTIGAVAIISVSAFKVFEAGTWTHNASPISGYRGVSEYLLKNSQPGEIVFNTRWDDFPQLFFLNSQNRYIVGMDPMFMYINDEKKYWLWRHISDDDASTCPEKTCSDKNRKPLKDSLQNDFHASYLLLGNSSNPLLSAKLSHDRQFEKIYSDAKISLYRLN